VKITVIATGFRDQMPERRARMLSVEQSPVVSVPVVAADSWMREQPPVSVVPAKPARPRFLSEDEEGQEETEEPAFFSASSPSAHRKQGVDESDLVGAPSSPQFAESAEPAGFTPLPRDFAPEFGTGSRTTAVVDEPEARPSTTRIAEAPEEPERDLDVPAFMRRLQF
jgi:cell division protein FtsZ